MSLPLPLYSNNATGSGSGSVAAVGKIANRNPTSSSTTRSTASSSSPSILSRDSHIQNVYLHKSRRQYSNNRTFRKEYEYGAEEEKSYDGSKEKYGKFQFNVFNMILSMSSMTKPVGFLQRNKKIILSVIAFQFIFMYYLWKGSKMYTSTFPANTRRQARLDFVGTQSNGIGDNMHSNSKDTTLLYKMEDSIKEEYKHLSSAFWRANSRQDQSSSSSSPFSRLSDLGIRHNGGFSDMKEEERDISKKQIDYQGTNYRIESVDNTKALSASNKIEDIRSNGIETQTHTDMILYDAKKNYIGGNFVPISLRKKDFLFFIRIQKTGSETMWKTLLNVFDGSHWSNNQKAMTSKGGNTKNTCSSGMFCGEICQKRVENYLEKIDQGIEKCRFIMRGHIGIYDFYNAVGHKYGDYRMADDDIAFFTILRDPVKRVLSEYTHITKNLVSQFGPKQYGKI